ncbi:MAG: hypothetical protein AUG49_09505 [Catenulispora sp. 13_1_20CM_3_70_7]|nr:MAG: hypothetical protein AUG49_09505 [Catenulispora sp. 13_1_20CM_3_70_7]
MQLTAVVVSLVISVIGFGLLGRTAVYIYQFVKLGQPIAPGARTNEPLERTRNLFREFAGHTRMARKGKRWIGAMHWVVMVGFGLLFFTLVTAYGQLFDADWAIPLIGRWWPFEFVVEVVAFVMIFAIAGLIGVRLRNRPSGPGSKDKGRRSRFFGSTMWQGYFVEWVIFGIGLCIMALRGLEGALTQETSYSLHYPFSYPLVHAFNGMSRSSLENAVYAVAMLKIVISMAWAITIGLNSTMGVAWHRFLAFPNIWFKKKADGGTALGALSPMVSAGVPIDFEDPAEDARFGVGAVEDFTWKGLLDFSTCTECGRCQDQCPAWNTDKPLSPKLLMLGLRDHAAAKAPYLFAGGGKDLEGNEKLAEEKWLSLPDLVRAEAERPLIGKAEDGGVIDPDVLWSCTTCGACVEQCPVDIEHVDHIVDMRRYQVMIESSFPSEAGTMLKNLEKAQNPWGIQRGRVPVLGRLRGLLGGPGEEDHQGVRRAAAHRRGQVRGARRDGGVHRRPGAPPGQRVPVPDAGAGQRGDAQRGVRRRCADGEEEDRGDLPALLQLAGERVSAARWAL